MFEFSIFGKIGIQCIEESKNCKNFNELLKHKIRTIISVYGYTREYKSVCKNEDMKYRYSFNKFGLNITFIDSKKRDYKSNEMVRIIVKDPETKKVLFDTEHSGNYEYDSWLPEVDKLYAISCSMIENTQALRLEHKNDDWKKINHYISLALQYGTKLDCNLDLIRPTINFDVSKVVLIDDDLLVVKYSNQCQDEVFYDGLCDIRDLKNGLKPVYRAISYESDPNNKSKNYIRLPFACHASTLLYEDGEWKERFCSSVAKLVEQETTEQATKNKMKIMNKKSK